MYAGNVLPLYYDAYTFQDKALCIDMVIGFSTLMQKSVTIVEHALQPAHLTPKGVKLSPEKNTALMCDLYRGRERRELYASNTAVMML